MVASLLVVLAVTTVRSRFDDPDMWLHMKMGQVIWTTHVIPTTDLFSFTTNHHAFIPHEWLSQLIIYGAYRWGGYSGLMLWLCFFTSALFIGGFGLCSLYSGNVKAGFLGALAVWQFATIGVAIRPQMIGYLFLIAELLLLHLGRTRNPRWFFALPPLFAVWVNCHGSFFLGIVLAWIISFSSYFDFQYGSLVAVRWDSRRRQVLTLSLGLSIAALFLNPAGAKLVLYPFHALVGMSRVASAVSEWQPLQLGDVRGLALLAILACIFLIVMVRRSELYFHELLFLAAATWQAASHRRLLFVFGLLVAPILSRLVAGLSNEHESERDHPIANAVITAVALVIAFLAFPTRQNLMAQVEQHSPVKAVDFIKDHHIPGPMLNEWTDGGYLVWAAPEYPDFIDGRGDPFDEAGVTEDFAKWATLEAAPGILLDKYHINFCLLGRDSPMTVVMELLPNWKIAYSDDKSVIFLRTPAMSPSS